jgi:cell fate regulator YaaT (PSP1 superfamily)
MTSSSSGKKQVVGIRFQRAGKVYYFNPSDYELEINDYVVVETMHGKTVGRVVITPRQILSHEIKEPLKPVLRKVSAEDAKKIEKMERRERTALSKCRELVAKFGLPMKPLRAQYNLEGTHVTIFFSAGERVDFRDLVRELATVLKARVELRQVGPRDEVKLTGGLGKCGRPLCCATFLTEFNPLSIKMAKEQNLPLNPMKISGICGRLLCCLGYENELYRVMKERMPEMGQQVNTPLGFAKVVGINPLKESVTVQLESEATAEVPLSDITKEKKKRPRSRTIPDRE